MDRRIFAHGSSLIVFYNCLLACVALLSTIGRSEGARGEVENGSS